MTFDFHVVYRVQARVRRLMGEPALFNDRMPPAKLARRLARLERWSGRWGSFLVADYLVRRETPSPGRMRWARSGEVRP